MTVDGVDEVFSSLRRRPVKFSNRIASPPPSWIPLEASGRVDVDSVGLTVCCEGGIALENLDFDLAKENLDVFGLKVDSLLSSSRICYLVISILPSSEITYSIVGPLIIGWQQ